MHKIYSIFSYVCEKMGGSISRDDLANLGYELLINEVKLELKSNIIPIGRIRVGTYYHRALLYKVAFIFQRLIRFKRDNPSLFKGIGR